MCWILTSSVAISAVHVYGFSAIAEVPTTVLTVQNCLGAQPTVRLS
jgi:hypothetical protein